MLRQKSTRPKKKRSKGKSPYAIGCQFTTELCAVLKQPQPNIDAALKILKRIKGLEKAIKLFVIERLDETTFSMNPLHQAAAKGLTEVVKECLSIGMNINARFQLKSALNYALKGRHAATAVLLLEQGIDTKHRYIMHKVAEVGLTDVVKAVVEHTKETVNTPKLGETPLECALRCGHGETALKLLELNAKYKKKTNPHKTPILHLAVASGLYQLVEPFLKNKVNINAADSTGCTALYRAITDGHVYIATLLLQYGADPNISKNYSPTHMAAQKGFVDLLPMLKQNGANLNRAVKVHGSNEPMTPFMSAIAAGQTDAAISLVLLGASIEITPKGNTTALHYAARFGMFEILDQLSLTGIPIDIKDSFDLTPLATAIFYTDTQNAPRHVKTVETLIRLGANVHQACGDKKKTPLHYAAEGTLTTEIVRILLAAGAEMKAKCVPFRSPTILILAATPLDISFSHKPTTGCGATLIEEGAKANDFEYALFSSDNLWNLFARLSKETLEHHITDTHKPSKSSSTRLPHPLEIGNRDGFNALDFLYLRELNTLIKICTPNSWRAYQFNSAKHTEAIEQILSKERYIKNNAAAQITLALLMAKASDETLNAIYPRAINKFAPDEKELQLDITHLTRAEVKDERYTAGFLTLVYMINEALYYEPFLAYTLTARLYKRYGDINEYYKWLAFADTIDTDGRFAAMRQSFPKDLAHFFHTTKLDDLVDLEVRDVKDNLMTTDAQRYASAIHYYLEILKYQSGDEDTLRLLKQCLLSALAYADQIVTGPLQQNPLHLLAIYFPNIYEETNFVDPEKLDTAVLKHALCVADAAGLTPVDYCVLLNATATAKKWSEKIKDNDTLNAFIKSEQAGEETTVISDKRKELITTIAEPYPTFTQRQHSFAAQIGLLELLIEHKALPGSHSTNVLSKKPAALTPALEQSTSLPPGAAHLVAALNSKKSAKPSMR